MNLRFKLAAAPVAYTLSQIPEARERQGALHEAIWAESGTVGARLKELVFLRTSMINRCHV